MNGGSGSDKVSGGEGTDVLFGGSGHDRVYGGKGNDQLDGGSGADTLKGGSGTDEIVGGAGDDWLSGGSGADVFYFRQNEGDGSVDTISDWDSGDVIALCGQTVRNFFVAKEEVANLQPSTSDVRNDVIVTLSDNNQIRILNAADDFTRGDTGALDTVAGNADDFIRDCPDFVFPRLVAPGDLERPFEICIL